MEAKLSKIYYSPQGYWKGLAAVKKLPSTAKGEEEVAKKMARQTSPLANISLTTTLHPSAKV